MILVKISLNEFTKTVLRFALKHKFNNESMEYPRLWIRKTEIVKKLENEGETGQCWFSPKRREQLLHAPYVYKGQH